MQILSGRRHKVQELAFSHCGRWLAASGYRGGLHVWDTANPTAKPRQPNTGRSQAAHSLAFRADGRLFYSVPYGLSYLFDPVTNQRRALGKQRLGHIVPSPDGQRFVRAYVLSSLRTWTIRDIGSPVAELSVKCPGAQILTAAFAPNGTTFATLERSHDAHYNASLTVTVRELSTGKPICSVPCPGVSMHRIAFSNDGTHLLARGWATRACWSIAEPNKPPRKATNPSRKHFLSMAVHPTGPLLTVANDRLVQVWDMPALTTDRSITWNIGKLYAVAVSPDGSRAAVGSHTGKVLVWDWD